MWVRGNGEVQKAIVISNESGYDYQEKQREKYQLKANRNVFRHLTVPFVQVD